MNLFELQKKIRDNWDKIQSDDGLASIKDILNFLNFKKDSVLYNSTKFNLKKIPDFLEHVSHGKYKLLPIEEAIIKPLHSSIEISTYFNNPRKKLISNILTMMVPVEAKTFIVSPNTKHSIQLSKDERLMCEGCNHFNEYEKLCNYYYVHKHPRTPACINIKKRKYYHPKFK